MPLRVVTPPAEDAVLLSLDEIKAQCRIDADDEDDLLTDLGATALEMIETDVQRRYLAQTLEWVCDTWPAGKPFPVAGIAGADGMEVTSVTYVDLDGASQVLDPSLYWVKASGQTMKIVPRWFVFWPLLGDGAERVVIQFTVPDGDMPRSVKSAAKLLVSHLYNHRDAVVGVEGRDFSTEIPLGVSSMLWRERWEAPAC